MQTAKELKELIDQLSPEFQEEMRDFVEFLLKRKVHRRGGSCVRIGQVL